MFKSTILKSLILVTQISCIGVAYAGDTGDLSPRGKKTTRTINGIKREVYVHLSEKDKNTTSEIANKVERELPNHKPGTSIIIKGERSLEFQVEQLSNNIRQQIIVNGDPIVGQSKRTHDGKDILAHAGAGAIAGGMAGLGIGGVVAGAIKAVKDTLNKTNNTIITETTVQTHGPVTKIVHEIHGSMDDCRISKHLADGGNLNTAPYLSNATDIKKRDQTFLKSIHTTTENIQNNFKSVAHNELTGPEYKDKALTNMVNNLQLTHPIKSIHTGLQVTNQEAIKNIGQKTLSTTQDNISDACRLGNGACKVLQETMDNGIDRATQRYIKNTDNNAQKPHDLSAPIETSKPKHIGSALISEGVFQAYQFGKEIYKEVPQIQQDLAANRANWIDETTESTTNNIQQQHADALHTKLNSPSYTKVILKGTAEQFMSNTVTALANSDTRPTTLKMGGFGAILGCALGACHGLSKYGTTTTREYPITLPSKSDE